VRMLDMLGGHFPIRGIATIAYKIGPGPGDVWGDRGTGGCALGESTATS
jgi:hypothetical protein